MNNTSNETFSDGTPIRWYWKYTPLAPFYYPCLIFNMLGKASKEAHRRYEDMVYAKIFEEDPTEKLMRELDHLLIKDDDHE